MRRDVLAGMLALVLAGLGAAKARAEVASVQPGAFLVQIEGAVNATPDQVWRALGHVERWWSPEHTYSGDARRLRLDVRAGGCFCERWGQGQSVEHARVVLVMEHEGVRTIRLNGALGPLQEMGPSGVLTFTISPDGAGASVALSYRVSGDAGLGLDQLAPLVDQVLMEQFARLLRYAGAGAPN